MRHPSVVCGVDGLRRQIRRRGRSCIIPTGLSAWLLCRQSSSVDVYNASCVESGAFQRPLDDFRTTCSVESRCVDQSHGRSGSAFMRVRVRDDAGGLVIFMEPVAVSPLTKAGSDVLTPNAKSIRGGSAKPLHFGLQQRLPLQPAWPPVIFDAPSDSRRTRHEVDHTRSRDSSAARANGAQATVA